MTEHMIFVEALRREDPAEQSAFVETACAGDDLLRRRVERLLRAHREAGSFLEPPPVGPFDQRDAPEPVTGEVDVTEAEETVLRHLAPPGREGSLGRLGHYEIQGIVGRGGMGVVLRAFDEKLHRTVAIKVMAGGLAVSGTARRRFIREARAAAAVVHEHVVTIHAVEEDHVPPYLVMQFVEGCSLQENLDASGPLELERILRIGMQVAEGLAAAHRQGLVHRDIKPANILLENGVERVKITDFGLARVADDASLTQSGVVAGTPQFMSPEQAAGLPLDHRSDLFSLGSVLYAACTGRPPFRAGTALAVLRRVAEEQPRPIREVNPDIPDWLCDLIAGLHAKDPERRIGSAVEVAARLADALARVQRSATRASASPTDEHRGVGRPAPRSQGGRTPRAVRGRLWGPVAAGILVVATALGASEAIGITRVSSTVIRLLGPEGTLVVEVDDPGVSVTIDDSDVVISGAGVKELRLRPGKHRVTARKGDEVVFQKLVSVTRGGRPVVRVSGAGPSVAAGQPGGGPSSQDLQRLVHLAEQKVDRERARYEVGTGLAVEVTEARIELVEAKLRLFAAGVSGEDVDRLYKELVTLNQSRLEFVNTLYELARVTRSEVNTAERAVLEARVRWTESRAARGMPAPEFPPMPRPPTRKDRPGAGPESGR